MKWHGKFIVHHVKHVLNPLFSFHSGAQPLSSESLPKLSDLDFAAAVQDYQDASETEAETDEEMDDDE